MVQPDLLVLLLLEVLLPPTGVEQHNSKASEAAAQCCNGVTS